jgi:hypothetical protein
MTEEPANGSGFTTKEMLVRMDGKLDHVLNRQAGYDVELALLKARADEQEKTQSVIEMQLETAKNVMATEVKALKDGQITLNKALKWATATVIGAGAILDAVIRFYHHG